MHRFHQAAHQAQLLGREPPTRAARLPAIRVPYPSLSANSGLVSNRRTWPWDARYMANIDS
jgi:hypothetical protein